MADVLQKKQDLSQNPLIVVNNFDRLGHLSYKKQRKIGKNTVEVTFSIKNTEH